MGQNGRCGHRVVSLGMLLLTAGITSAETWHVDVDNCPGPGDGTAANPFCSIQAAIDVADDLDAIEVQPGIYNEQIDLLGKALRLESTDGAQATTISGANLSGSVVTITSGEGSGTRLQGFTIRDGSAGAANGGGMVIASSSPSIVDCCFTGNTADYGGGVFVSSSTPVLIDCLFEQNSAVNSGGAFYNFGGPGQPGAILYDCEFRSNNAGSSGGAMRTWDTSPTLIHCEFEENLAERYGGAIANGGHSQAKLYCCLFRSNRVDPLFGNWDSYGGGVHNSEQAGPLIVNCVFDSNVAETSPPGLGRGGAVSSVGQATLRMVNCTLSANAAVAGAGVYNDDVAQSSIANSILWDGPNEVVSLGNSQVDIRYSNVKDSWPGPGNIDADPVWEELRLRRGSPCIDAGENAALPPDTFDLDGDHDFEEPLSHDIDGRDRQYDDPATPDTGAGVPPLVDMGAYEFPKCPGDFNHDRQRDQADLGILLAAYLVNDGGDMDGDGVTNQVDLGYFLAAYGLDCP